MPVPKGTKPNIVNFAEVNQSVLMQALRVASTHKEHPMVIRSDTVGGHTVWKDGQGRVIAKRYIHRKSTQCLISRQLYEMLPHQKEHDTQEVRSA